MVFSCYPFPYTENRPYYYVCLFYTEIYIYIFWILFIKLIYNKENLKACYIILNL